MCAAAAEEPEVPPPVEKELAYQQGEVIVDDYVPLFYYLKKRLHDKLCNWCMLENTPQLNVCSCRSVAHCSESCRNLDMEFGHELECSSPCFRELCEQDETDQMLFAFRMYALLQMIPDFGANPFPVVGGSKLTLDNMTPHQGNQQWVEEKRQEATTLVDMIKASHPDSNVQVDDIFRYMAIFAKYGFRIYMLGSYVQIGVCLFEKLANFRHSCKPTAVVARNGLALSVRAIAPIPTGTQPTIDYLGKVGLDGPRQAEIQRLYGFVCECESCHPDAPKLFSNTPRMLHKLLSAPTRVLASPKCWCVMYSIFGYLRISYRKVYYEWDERITQLYLMALKFLLLAKTPTRKAWYEIINETGVHIKNTYGEYHHLYAYYQNTDFEERKPKFL